MNVRIVIAILIVLCFLGTPIFPYVHWGWAAPGSLGTILFVLLILALLGII